MNALTHAFHTAPKGELVIYADLEDDITETIQDLPGQDDSITYTGLFRTSDVEADGWGDSVAWIKDAELVGMRAESLTDEWFFDRAETIEVIGFDALKRLEEIASERATQNMHD